MLSKVLWELCGIDQSESDEFAKKIISGLYREMRKEETPKPVLLLAACEVLEHAIIDKGYRLDLRVKNFDEFRLADLLIHFGDEVAIAQTKEDLGSL